MFSEAFEPLHGWIRNFPADEYDVGGFGPHFCIADNSSIYHLSADFEIKLERLTTEEGDNEVWEAVSLKKGIGRFQMGGAFKAIEGGKYRIYCPPGSKGKIELCSGLASVH